MINLVIVRNPLQPHLRETVELAYQPDKSLAQYLEENGLQTGFISSISGVVVDNPDTAYPLDGDYLVAMPILGSGLKDVFRLVLSIALSSYVGNILNGDVKWISSKLGKYLAAGAVSFLGGRIINTILPYDQPKLPAGAEQSPNYGWNTGEVVTQQGNAVGRTYGTVRIKSPQLLAYYVSVQNDKQYLNMLLCGGEGPVNSITDITIDDNPVANYKDVTVETRLGTNDQSVISNFGDTFAAQSLSYELSTDTWTTHQTDGNAGKGIELTFEFPGGLYYLNGKGKLKNATVNLRVEYRQFGGAWTFWAEPSYTASKNVALRRNIRIDNLPAGRYEVRCKCSYKSGTNTTRYGTRVVWSGLSHILYEDFQRPNKVLVSIKALATDQLSGSMPSVKWTQTRNTVWAYNPDSGQYEAKRADSPAWATYDMYHQCFKLRNINSGQDEFVVEGMTADRLLYDEFTAGAVYDDETVDGDKRHYIDFYFDQPQTLWDATRAASLCGRGVAVPRGTKLGYTVDKVRLPVQLFSMGNITKQSFKGHFIGKKDRASVAEVSYTNREKKYESDTLAVYGSYYDAATTIDNPAKISRPGITRSKQAYREGQYALRQNERIGRMVDIEADIDAIVCQGGDVVLVQHDIPRWGSGGGRIVSATSTAVQLDRQVTLTPGQTYKLRIRLIDDTLVVKTVVTPATETTTDTVTVTTPLEILPAPYDLYAFGAIEVKPFVVSSMTRAGDLKVKLSLTEYDEAVYTDEPVPVIDYSALSTETVEISNLAVGQETYREKDGTVISLLHVSWRPPTKAIKSCRVLYRRQSEAIWELWNGAIGDNVATIAGVASQETYLVKVCTVNGIGVVSPGVESDPIYITGKDNPPSNITSLTAFIDPADRTRITLTWPEVEDIDLRGYRLSEGATVLTPTPISDTRYAYSAITSRQHTFSVVAIDNSENSSVISATVMLAVIVEPPNVTEFTAIPQATDRSQLILNWSAVEGQDLSYYEIRQGSDGWDTAEVIVTQLKSTRYLHQLAADGYQTYMVKAYTVGGHASVAAASASLQVALRPDAPTNLTAVQEQRDRSILQLAWTASPGKDLAGYDVFINSVQVTTEKNTNHGWKIPASSTYTIAVRARTVAGYVSNAVNITVSPMIEADDVTGFTAVQQMSDRTRVRLMWDASSGDVAYHEIRKGVSWDAAIVVGERVTGTFYDVIVLEESVQIFWIKAVTAAGKYSQNPIEYEGTFNLNPLPVSDIQLSQDPNDRSIVNIAFNATPESDLANYEIRVGYVWQDAVEIGKTKEWHWMYSPAQTGDVKVMIKAVNAAGFYSDEVSATLYVTLEPGNVTGFRVFQNGERLAFVWSPVSDNDIVGYELREGGNYENGTIVATGITLTQYQLAVDTEIIRRFHVKAINRSGHYSASAISVSVTITDLAPKNVIQSYDEIALQSGIHSGTEFGESLITFDTLPGTFADYPTTKFSDIGGAIVLKLAPVDGAYPPTGTYSCVRKDIGQIITANIAAIFQPSILYTAGTTAAIEYRTSRDPDQVVWTDWQPFSPLEATFRYVDFRVNLATQDITKTPEVNQFSIRIDVPDKDIGKSVVVPVGGIKVAYGHTFYELPVVTPTAEGNIGRAVWSNKTKSDVELQVVNNDTSADIGGNVDLRVKGY